MSLSKCAVAFITSLLVPCCYKIVTFNIWFALYLHVGLESFLLRCMYLSDLGSEG